MAAYAHAKTDNVGWAMATLESQRSLAAVPIYLYYCTAIEHPLKYTSQPVT